MTDARAARDTTATGIAGGLSCRTQAARPLDPNPSGGTR